MSSSRRRMAPEPSGCGSCTTSRSPGRTSGRSASAFSRLTAAYASCSAAVRRGSPLPCIRLCRRLVRVKNSALSVPMTTHFTSTPSSRRIVIMRGIISATPPPRAVELTIQTVRPLEPRHERAGLCAQRAHGVRQMDVSLIVVQGQHLVNGYGLDQRSPPAKTLNHNLQGKALLERRRRQQRDLVRTVLRNDEAGGEAAGRRPIETGVRSHHVESSR